MYSIANQNLKHYQEDIKHTRRHAIQTTVQTTQDPSYNNTSSGDNDHRDFADNWNSYDDGEIGGTDKYDAVKAEAHYSTKWD